MTLGHPTRINQSSSAFNVQINIEIENDSQLAASRTPGACMSHIFSAHVGRLGDERRGEGMWRWTQFGCKRKLGKPRVNTSKQIGYSYQILSSLLSQSHYPTGQAGQPIELRYINMASLSAHAAAPSQI